MLRTFVVCVLALAVIILATGRLVEGSESLISPIKLSEATAASYNNLMFHTPVLFGISKDLLKQQQQQQQLLLRPFHVHGKMDDPDDMRSNSKVSYPLSHLPSPTRSPTAAPVTISTSTISAKLNSDEVTTTTTTEATTCSSPTPQQNYGRISEDEFILTPEQIETFHREGCVTIPNVLTDDEMTLLDVPFNRLIEGKEIDIPGKDFCDMSKPFGTPFDEWSIVNCMLPTRYDPSFANNNILERITHSMAQQLFRNRPSTGESSTVTTNNNSSITMIKDYDQLLNKRPGKTDAVFAWHQDMAYWPGPAALNVSRTDTCTFSLAMDDSTPENGCLRYVVGSGRDKTLRRHVPLHGANTTTTTTSSTSDDDNNNNTTNNKTTGRDEGHALTLALQDDDVIKLAPASRGSITIHDEYVVHGSGGNHHPHQSRRTYVIAYRAQEIVQAERRIGFTHSHNDVVNWDTFLDGEAHRIAVQQQQQQQQQQQPQKDN